MAIASMIFYAGPSLASVPERQQIRSFIVPSQDRLYPVGRMPLDTVLHLAVSIPILRPEELDQLTKSITDPQSPQYRHFLTPQEFTRRFGPTQSDYDAVITFFKRRGFNITTYPNRTLLDIDGTVGMIEETFHTTLWVYKHPSEKRNFYAPDENPSIDLDIPLSNVAGLDNFIRFKPLASGSK